ncbi:hypothetical protein ACFQV2_22845 [Actinokineospora soli]|uniref:Phosphonopyruvate decarboxylase n=1 Tax=Actinokineospora soli TaxID=1048753 RepID=A0ABW2TQW1_9PSEU
MNRTAAIRAIITATTVEPVVYTTEATCRAARSIADRRNHLYLTVGQGMASSLGIGVAMQIGRPTVVVDAYGSLARNPMGLITAGSVAGLRLVHVVLDDGLFGAGQSAASPSGRADICALARASGYASVSSTARADRFLALLRNQLATATRPVLIRCLLSEPDEPAVPSAGLRTVDLPENARRFQDTIGALSPVPRTA